jgi:hypothetical protein
MLSIQQSLGSCVCLTDKQSSVLSPRTLCYQSYGFHLGDRRRGTSLFYTRLVYDDVCVPLFCCCYFCHCGVWCLRYKVKRHAKRSIVTVIFPSFFVIVIYLSTRAAPAGIMCIGLTILMLMDFANPTANPTYETLGRHV